MISIRPAVFEDHVTLGRVHVLAWQTAYRGIVPDPYLDQMDPERSTARLKKLMDAGDRHTFVADHDAVGVVGFATLSALRQLPKGCDCELEAIYLLADWRGQGIGTRLLRAAMDKAIDMGYTAMGVWVLEENEQGRAFYDATGAQPSGETAELELGGKALTEMAYVWKDLKLLREMLA